MTIIIQKYLKPTDLSTAIKSGSTRINPKGSVRLYMEYFRPNHRVIGLILLGSVDIFFFLLFLVKITPSNFFRFFYNCPTLKMKIPTQKSKERRKFLKLIINIFFFSPLNWRTHFFIVWKWDTKCKNCFIFLKFFFFFCMEVSKFLEVHIGRTYLI